MWHIRSPFVIQVVAHWAVALCFLWRPVAACDQEPCETRIDESPTVAPALRGSVQEETAVVSHSAVEPQTAGLETALWDQLSSGNVSQRSIEMTSYKRSGTNYPNPDTWPSTCSVKAVDDKVCASLQGYANDEDCGWIINEAGYISTVGPNSFANSGDYVLLLGYAYNTPVPQRVAVTAGTPLTFHSDAYYAGGLITLCFEPIRSIEMTSYKRWGTSFIPDFWPPSCSVKVVDDKVCARVEGYANDEDCGWTISEAGYISTVGPHSFANSGDYVMLLGYAYSTSVPQGVPVAAGTPFSFHSDAAYEGGQITLCFEPEEEEEECYTSAEGEQCHSAVVWAQQHGILQHSEWYEGLTHHSSFEAFQDHLSERGQGNCQRPCNLCRTAMEGERCFEMVQWAMLVGIREHPEWYPGLASGSSFEEFQSLLHRNGGRKGDCPTAPCNLCRTVTEGGELCFKEVDWAMTHGIHSHPEWYPGLSVNSSRAEFQKYLSLEYDCPQACSLCRTAEPGEPCHQGVMWAMRHGIEAHPAWYPELEANSSFEAFQAHLHQGRFKNCAMPCDLEDE